MGLVSHTPALNACNCRLLYKSCSASSVRSGLYAWRWVPAVLIPHSFIVILSAVFFRTIFLTALSPSFLLPCPWVPSPRGPPVPSVFLNVSHPCFPLFFILPFLLFPLSSVLVVSFYLYTGLQTFPPMATLAMRASPWLTGSPHPPLWVPLYLWRHRNLCHFIAAPSAHARFNNQYQTDWHGGEASTSQDPCRLAFCSLCSKLVQQYERSLSLLLMNLFITLLLTSVWELFLFYPHYLTICIRSWPQRH